MKVLTDYKQLEKFGGIVMKLKKHSLNYLEVPLRKEHDFESHKEQLLNSDYSEIRLIVATNPKSLSSIPSKTPEIMEMGLSGEI